MRAHTHAMSPLHSATPTSTISNVSGMQQFLKLLLRRLLNRNE